MNNLRYEYSPIIRRKRIKWPKDARVAVWVIPNIEHFDFDEAFPGSGPAAGKIPDVMNFSARDYGNRIGVWRIMDVLDKYGIKATVSLNSDVCEYYPIIIEEGKKRGWEFMGHGIKKSKVLIGLSEDEEREVVATTIRTISRSVGKAPEGWLSPGLAETFNTPDILAEEGIKYICDWSNDDQPYAMKVLKGTLISIPYSTEVNDMPAFLTSHLTSEDFYHVIKDQFDVFYSEGATNGRVMSIGLHPFLIGLPSKIGCLDRALKYISSHQDVWFATGAEICDWYCRHYLDTTS